MILIFSDICKYYKKIININEYELLLSAMNSHKTETLHHCPVCNAPGEKYSCNGAYSRHFVYLDKGSVKDSLVKIDVVLCSSCRKSHAMLDFLITPRSSYSTLFLISLLYYRLTRKIPAIDKLCEVFGISENTYYRIRRRYLSDARFLKHALDVLNAALPSDEPVAYLFSNPDRLADILSVFFNIAGYSFLQPLVRLRLKLKGVP